MLRRPDRQAPTAPSTSPLWATSSSPSITLPRLWYTARLASIHGLLIVAAIAVASENVSRMRLGSLFQPWAFDRYTSATARSSSAPCSRQMSTASSSSACAAAIPAKLLVLSASAMRARARSSVRSSRESASAPWSHRFPSPQWPRSFQYVPIAPARRVRAFRVAEFDQLLQHGADVVVLGVEQAHGAARRRTESFFDADCHPEVDEVVELPSARHLGLAGRDQLLVGVLAKSPRASGSAEALCGRRVGAATRRPAGSRAPPRHRRSSRHPRRRLPPRGACSRLRTPRYGAARVVRVR